MPDDESFGGYWELFGGGGWFEFVFHGESLKDDWGLFVGGWLRFGFGFGGKPPNDDEGLFCAGAGGGGGGSCVDWFDEPPDNDVGLLVGVGICLNGGWADRFWMSDRNGRPDLDWVSGAGLVVRFEKESVLLVLFLLFVEIPGRKPSDVLRVGVVKAFNGVDGGVEAFPYGWRLWFKLLDIGVSLD